MRSAPAPPLTVMVSVASAFAMRVRCASPLIETSSPLVDTAITSLREPPFTVTVSAAPSPVVPPAAPARSMCNSRMSVARRSPISMVSAPPAASSSTRSTLAWSMTMLPTLRVSIASLAAGLEREALVGVRAVELMRVEARLAVDDVAAFARIPLEAVVARAHGHVSVPRPPLMKSAPALPMMRSSPSSANKFSVARPAVSPDASMVSLPAPACASMRSMPSMSMTMLPTSRLKLSRWPLAEIVNVSLAALPLNSNVSVPAWPSTTSLPSPGSHWNTSSPAPMRLRPCPAGRR